jgi:hypothetical protein
MNELFAILMSWAVTLSGYPRPATGPEIVMVPHSYLVAEACAGRECKVLGWYPPGQKIFLDDRLDPANSLYASSIVVHEMVHFLQQQFGHFEEGFTCASALGREREAYTAQREFLLRSGVYQPVGASMHSVGCEHTHDADAKSAEPEGANGLSSATPRNPQHQLRMSASRKGITLTADSLNIWAD